MPKNREFNSNKYRPNRNKNTSNNYLHKNKRPREYVKNNYKPKNY